MEIDVATLSNPELSLLDARLQILNSEVCMKIYYTLHYFGPIRPKTLQDFIQISKGRMHNELARMLEHGIIQREEKSSKHTEYIVHPEFRLFEEKITVNHGENLSEYQEELQHQLEHIVDLKVSGFHSFAHALRFEYIRRGMTVGESTQTGLYALSDDELSEIEEHYVSIDKILQEAKSRVRVEDRKGKHRTTLINHMVTFKANDGQN